MARPFRIRFRLRTLLLLMAVLQAFIAGIWFWPPRHPSSFVAIVIMGVVLLVIGSCVVGSFEASPSKRWRHVLSRQDASNLSDHPASDVPVKAPELVTARIADLEEELSRATLLVHALAETCVEQGVFTRAEIDEVCRKISPPILIEAVLPSNNNDAVGAAARWRT